MCVWRSGTGEGACRSEALTSAIISFTCGRESDSRVAIRRVPQPVAVWTAMVYTLCASPMNAPAFITQLVTALAWPVTVLICVVVLRPLLVGLLPLIRKLKYSDVEIQFGREVA